VKILQLPVRKIFSKVIFMLLFLMLAGAGVLYFFLLEIPSFESIKKAYKPSDAWLLDRHNRPLVSIRKNKEIRRLEWSHWTEVSPVFQNLLVEVEDRRFYYHFGLDPLALAQALWDGMRGKGFRGASTITMQLAGMLSPTKNTYRRSINRKINQAILAIKLHLHWTRREILEAYINYLPFRGELIGLRSASLGYFQKNPDGLHPDESALLIAMIRSPNAPVDLIARRACQVLKETNCKDLSLRAWQIFSNPYLIPRDRELIPIVSKHFLKSELNQSVVHTSIDYKIQEIAMKALREQLAALRSQNVHDGAVVVLDTQSGEVLAYVANAGPFMTSGVQVDGILSRRQAGSTIKPFVYGTAFDLNILKPNSLLEDIPEDISVASGQIYHPKNYDHIFRGVVGVGDALGSSLNVPAVKVLELVGSFYVLEKLKTIGFTNLKDDDYYGPSLALGSIDVSLWELTHGYRQLAADSSPFSLSSRQAIFNILASPEHRRFTFGMDSVLTLPFAAAVKTGTSKDMRDNWCIGWTSQYTVGVWVGNFNGDSMWNVSGMTGAAPTWRNIMLSLHSNPDNPQLVYEKPAELLLTKTISRIRYPAPDMFVAQDPDVPSDLQKLPIEIENPQSDHKIFLNNKFWSKAKAVVLWPLKNGRFNVELRNSLGQIVDAVKFEVR